MYEELKEQFIQADTPYIEGAVDVFRQVFPGDGVRKATLCITALGIYEAEINGEKIGDIMFAPGYTYYHRMLQVQTFDVTEMVAEQENCLQVYLGQGWYCGRYTFENKCQVYGEHTAVAWILTVEKECGTTVYTSNDGTVTMLESPYTYAGIYDGEIYHANDLRALGTKPIAYAGKVPEALEEGILYTGVEESIDVLSAVRHGDVTILDFGQNFAGIVEIDPAHMHGEMLKLRHGEILNADGSLYTKNLRKAKAETIYYKGAETKKYRPRFTFMGFRYVELSGVEYEEGLLRAYVVHSRMERTGYFFCGNEKVEQLYRNQVWGQRSNYLEVPTDCPQRDERMGYTGDGHVFARTGAYNYDTEAFLAKFLKDIRYTQMDNTEGYVAPVVPARGPEGIGFMSMLGWGNAVTILPWLLWQQYGEFFYLREQYESMKAHVECEIRHMGKGLMGKKDLWVSPSLGDWLAPGKDVKYMAMHNGPVSNAFIVNDLRILSETADLLGKKEDAARYRNQLDKTLTAYLKAFVKKDGKMKDDYQGAYIMALQMVIPKGELWDACFCKLIEKIREEGMQTGFFATQHLLPLLADNGYEKLAFDLLLNENCPGWLYQVNCGATTTWERWDALRPDGTVNESKMSGDNMVSFNHYSFGSVGEFYYRYILGIQPLEPGYAKVRLRPFVDSRLGHVEGSYRSRAGEIKMAWRVEGDKATICFTTPVATRLVLPDGTERDVDAGNYQFEGIDVQEPL
ncbi:MAG: glycoside hydrolase family 78 protein [Lachnospiraceae bacterium]|nr:glycoside hydrolase family 78 protein [Lachnospiraceae bacterium]